ncbi:MAG: mechanosensitive ion channel family protein [Rhodothermales bacterium]|nr:mechanosensitive ion channel family protein [Rhodothermales bacterium]
MNAVTEALASVYVWLQEVTGLREEILGDLLGTLAVFVVLWVLRAVAFRLVHQRTTDVRTQYQWRKTVSYVTVAVGILLIGRIWIGELGGLATFLGLVSAGLAIALRDPVVNLAGWAFIVWRRPFGPGDRIGLLEHAGDVIDQRLFQFTLLEIGTPTGAAQSTGRIIHVPNGKVFTEPVINYTRGFQYIWNEIAVVVTFESDWRAAKEILLGIAHECAEHLSEDAERKVRQAAQEYMIFYSKLTPTVYTSVVDVGVQLTIRYLVEPRRRRGTEETIWEAILDAFGARDDIDLAYPTQRLFYNVTEGKPQARAHPGGDTGFGPAGMRTTDGGEGRERR